MNEMWLLTALAVLIAMIAILVVPSIRIIGPTEVGLVTKRFALSKLPDDNPIAFRGEPGYQADLLMPGWHFKLWLLYAVEKHPWVQVRAGEIGVVVAQVGSPLPIGAKSAESFSDLNLITNLHAWLQAGGQKGVQRPVLPPGSLMPVNPVGFLVITRQRVYGVPVAQQFQRLQAQGKFTYQAFGLEENQLKVTVITPRSAGGGGVVDTCGIVTALEGQPLPSAAIAGRLGEFEDVKRLEGEHATDQTLIEALIGSKSAQHNNYQDYDAFLRAGGKIGLQHDTLLYGAYLLNPFLVRVEEVPMLVIKRGGAGGVPGAVMPGVGGKPAGPGTANEDSLMVGGRRISGGTGEPGPSLPRSTSRTNHFQARATISETASCLRCGHLRWRKKTRPCRSMRGTRDRNTSWTVGRNGLTIMGTTSRQGAVPVGPGRLG